MLLLLILILAVKDFIIITTPPCLLFHFHAFALRFSAAADVSCHYFIRGLPPGHRLPLMLFSSLIITRHYLRAAAFATCRCHAIICRFSSPIREVMAPRAAVCTRYFITILYEATPALRLKHNSHINHTINDGIMYKQLHTPTTLFSLLLFFASPCYYHCYAER